LTIPTKNRFKRLKPAVSEVIDSPIGTEKPLQSERDSHQRSKGTDFLFFARGLKPALDPPQPGCLP